MAGRDTIEFVKPFILGLCGAGKSTLTQKLAEIWALKFVDTDNPFLVFRGIPYGAGPDHPAILDKLDELNANLQTQLTKEQFADLAQQVWDNYFARLGEIGVDSKLIKAIKLLAGENQADEKKRSYYANDAIFRVVGESTFLEVFQKIYPEVASGPEFEAVQAAVSTA